MPKQHISRHGRLLLASLALGALASIGAAWWYYLQQREATTAATVQSLYAIAEGKADVIRNWRRERMGDGRVLAANSMQAIRVLKAPSQAAGERAFLTDVLRRFCEEYQYEWGAVISADGRVVLHSDGAGPD